MTLKETGITMAENVTLEPETLELEITEIRPFGHSETYILATGEVILNVYNGPTLWYESLDAITEFRCEICDERHVCAKCSYYHSTGMVECGECLEADGLSLEQVRTH